MKKYIAMTMALCVAVVAIAAFTMKTATEKRERVQTEETVELTVWASEDGQDILEQMVDGFIREYGEEADLQIHMGIEEEKSAWENIHANPRYAADVFFFTDDQMDNMVRDEILLPVTVNSEKVIEASGGKDATAVESAMRNGILYAYPMTASNGYYLYYNSEYFTKDDVQTLDRILEIAEANEKYFAMDWTSGWYLYSFFKGAGLNVETGEDSVTNVCDWNSTTKPLTGADVVNAMIEIAASDAFFNAPDVALKNGFSEGKVIAGVSGAWNAEFMEKCLGDNCEAVKLPTYTVKGQQVQMASFEGFKLVGVNHYTKEAKWAMRLADWITSYDNQILRYNAIGELPANQAVLENGDIEISKAVRALWEQSEFSNIQRIGSNYWDAATVFGTVIASENKDGLDIQNLLDELVETLASDNTTE